MSLSHCCTKKSWTVDCLILEFPKLIVLHAVYLKNVLIIKVIWFLESETSEFSQSSGGLQTETEIAPSLRILRVHATKRDGEISERVSRNHYKAAYMANSAGHRVLSSTRLRSQGCKTGKYFNYSRWRSEIVRFWFRTNAQSWWKLHRIRRN